MKKKYKFKGSIDFYKYLFKINRREGISLLISLILFLISFISVIDGFIYDESREVTSNNRIFFILLFAFSLFNILWDLLGKYQEIRQFTKKGREIRLVPKRIIVKDDISIPMSNLVPEPEKGWGQFQYQYAMIGKTNQPPFLYNNLNTSNIKIAIYSPLINEYLWDNDITIEIKKERTNKLESFIRINKDISIPFFQYRYYMAKKENKMLYNEDKLSLGGDISLGSTSISCYKSNYYNSLLTNEISGYALARQDGTILYNATNFYPCEYDPNSNIAYLQALKTSSMSNHIGISTLALTKDNYLVIRKQNSKNQQNSNLFVPAGSGSCDWTDLKGNSLQETVKYAMQRELWEENGGGILKSDVESIGNTKLLGFFRWIDRGGKHEFVGITKLNCNVDDLKANTVELEDLSNRPERDMIYIENIDELIKYLNRIEENTEQISLPLYMSLKAALQYFKERRSHAEAFLDFK